MKRTKLVAARARKSWTLERAAERIGCAPNTLSRWELGVMVPSSYNRARLCAVYGMTIEELGLEEEVILLTNVATLTSDFQIYLDADLTMRLLALVLAPQGNSLKLQAVLSRTIEEFAMDTSHEAALTRREALRRLAMLPVLFGISTGMQRPVEDTLHQCAAGITACEYLSKGNHNDMALAYSMVPMYLQVLKPIVKESSLYRKEAAALVTQSYLLMHVLGLHVQSPDIAMRYAKLAVVNSKESGDLSLQVTALRRLTWEYLEDKQPGQSLKTIEQARFLIENSHRPVSSHVRSSIYGTLAVIQAKNGVSAISALYLAQEAFFAPNVTGDEFGSVSFSYAQLMRNDGLAHSHEGRYKQALESYSQVIDPENLSPKVVMPVRTHAELLHCQTMATLKSPARDMEQVIVLWKADITSAVTLQSQQRFEEACTAYEVMEGVWPNERRIMELRDLIVHW